ncbi:MAG: TIGR03087 family PEP-CTERM/XrtA system glycosyltransferase [Vicinamibacterales bacterium]
MNVLFLTHRLPYAPNRGDRIRAYYLLQELSRFADVSLFSLVHDEEERSHVEDVPFATRVETALVPRLGNLARGALRLPTSAPLTHSLLDAPGTREALARLVRTSPPDVVLAYCSGMARFALEPPLSTYPFVLDMVDVDSAKWADLSRQTAPPRRWIYQREAHTLARFEAHAAMRARAVTVVSDRERVTMEALAPAANVLVLPNGVDVASFTRPPDADELPTVVFSGMMDYEPNVEAVEWFAVEVWPRVRQVRADARFVIVGANPVAAVHALAERDPSITVTGRVESVQPHLWKAAVSVAPVRVARGLQNKVLEALAAGVPTVVCSAVHAGLPAGVDRGCVVADAPDEFAHAVVTLLGQTGAARRATAEASGVGALAWPRQLAPLRQILERAREQPHTSPTARTGLASTVNRQSTPERGATHRFALLDPLRGIAALWVFLYHADFSDPWWAALGLHALGRLGDMGVPMFFVLSGFCITGAGRSAARAGSVLTFVYRRVRRIYPPYWASVAVVAALPFAIELISSLKTGHYVAPSAEYINNGFMRYGLWDWVSVLSLTRVFAPDPAATTLQYKFTTINAVYWTLAIEVQFYLAVAVAVWARRHFYRVLGVVTALSIPFALSGEAYRTGLFLPYWPMFAVGGVIYWLFERGVAPTALWSARRAAACWVAALSAGVAALAMYAATGRVVHELPFAFLFGAFLFVAEGVDGPFQRMVGSSRGAAGLMLKLPLILGAMSYSVYLLHGRLQFLSLQLVRQLVDEHSLVSDTGVLAVTLALCYPFYLVCERPFAGVRSAARPHLGETPAEPLLTV